MQQQPIIPPPPPPPNHGSAQALTAGMFNATGDMYGYAVSYDWHRGVEGFDTRIPNKLFVHTLTDADLRGTA